MKFEQRIHASEKKYRHTPQTVLFDIFPVGVFTLVFNFLLQDAANEIEVIWYARPMALELRNCHSYFPKHCKGVSIRKTFKITCPTWNTLVDSPTRKKTKFKRREGSVQIAPVAEYHFLLGFISKYWTRCGSNKVIYLYMSGCQLVIFFFFFSFFRFLFLIDIVVFFIFL